MGGLAIEDIRDICVGNKFENRSKLLSFEEHAAKQPQLDVPVKHTTHGGMYGRQITIPKGTAVTGAIYKFDHLDIMISGDITVSTDTDAPKRFTGYNLFEGLSGKKRAGYAHEDTTWITVHPFDNGTGEDIQNFVTVDSFEELEEFNTIINREDYLYLLSDMGLTDDDVSRDMELIPVVEGFEENTYISDSHIAGVGVYNKTSLVKGDFIGIARNGKDKTTIGRYTNHALYPNSNAVLNGDDVAFVANRPIEIGEEITVNYREVLKVGITCQV